ncbi:MAG: T9SS type A sorting domain-containing protein [Saprospiraceae bacterium]
MSVLQTMRYLYTCILLSINYLAFSQVMLPLETNPVLERHAAQEAKEKVQFYQQFTTDIPLRAKDNDECPIVNEDIGYLNFGDTLLTNVDTTVFGGGVANNASLTCLNCDDPTLLGTVALIEVVRDSLNTNDEVVTDVNGDPIQIKEPILRYIAGDENGRDTVRLEFCNDFFDCFELPFEFITRRAGQVFRRDNITLRRGEGRLIKLPLDDFPGELECSGVTTCAFDNYEGEADFWISRAKPNEFFYGADSYNGNDTVCFVICDNFSVCDTFINSFTITGDTLQLPFMDDFSYAGPFPDTSLWLERDAFVNNSMAIDPPSFGVATFDGLDASGTPRGGDIGESDLLTSNYLDLTSNNNNLFLSFYLQPKGLGDRPETADNFIVEFKKQDGTWQQITSIPGVSDTIPFGTNFPFRFLSYPVDQQYLYNGFQFRFTAINGRQGALDLWHLDYVRLESNANSQNVNDLAFATYPKAILKDYTAMPWNHFVENANGELRSTNETAFFNHRDQTNNVDDSDVELTELNSNTTLTAFGFGSVNVPSQEYSPLEFNIIGIDNLANDIISLPEQERYDLSLLTRLFSEGQSGLEAIRRNDEVTRTTTLSNYFAHDDGTAESNIIAQNFSNVAVQVATEFTANIGDSLQAVQFHIPRATGDISSQQFFINIWFDRDQIGGEPDFTSNSQRVFYVDSALDSLQGFTTYALDSAIFIPAGKFWIGWEQFSNCTGTRCIPVGYDLNTPEANQFNFFNPTGENFAENWESFDSLGTIPPGALMIRPVMGEVKPLSTEEAVVDTEELSDLEQQITLFPNPTSGIVNIEIKNNDNQDLRLELYSATGQLLIARPLQRQLDLSNFPTGMYFIKIINQVTQESVNRKVLRSTGF